MSHSTTTTAPLSQETGPVSQETEPIPQETEINLQEELAQMAADKERLQAEIAQLKLILAANGAAAAAAAAATAAATAAANPDSADGGQSPIVPAHEFSAASPSGEIVGGSLADEQADIEQWNLPQHAGSPADQAEDQVEWDSPLRLASSMGAPGAPRRPPGPRNLSLGSLLPPPRQLQFDSEPYAKRVCAAGVEITCTCGRSFRVV